MDQCPHWDKSVIANLNGFKHELALAAVDGVLALLSGGADFTLQDLLMHCKSSFDGREMAGA